MNDQLRRAIDLARNGEWDAAHRIVQEDEGATAAWIHAVLHKIEGDLGNSRYWYSRAGKMAHFEEDPQGELDGIRALLAP